MRADIVHANLIFYICKYLQIEKDGHVPLVHLTLTDAELVVNIHHGRLSCRA